MASQIQQRQQVAAANEAMRRGGDLATPQSLPLAGFRRPAGDAHFTTLVLGAARCAARRGVDLARSKSLAAHDASRHHGARPLAPPCRQRAAPACGAAILGVRRVRLKRRPADGARQPVLTGGRRGGERHPLQSGEHGAVRSGNFRQPREPLARVAAIAEAPRGQRSAAHGARRADARQSFAARPHRASERLLAACVSFARLGAEARPLAGVRVGPATRVQRPIDAGVVAPSTPLLFSRRGGVGGPLAALRLALLLPSPLLRARVGARCLFAAGEFPAALDARPRRRLAVPRRQVRPAAAEPSHVVRAAQIERRVFRRCGAITAHFLGGDKTKCKKPPAPYFPVGPACEAGGRERGIAASSCGADRI